MKVSVTLWYSSDGVKVFWRNHVEMKAVEVKLPGLFPF